MIEALGAISLMSAGVGALSAFWFYLAAGRDLDPERVEEIRARSQEIVDLAARHEGKSQWRLHVGVALGAGLVYGGLAVDGAGGWAVIGGILLLLAISGFLVDLGARRRLRRALEAIDQPPSSMP